MNYAISRSRVLEALEAEKARLMEQKDAGWPFTTEVLVRAVDTVIEFIKGLPALDVAPVVRCRDCKYRCTQNCPMFHTEWYYDDDDGSDCYDVDRTDDHGFCYRGERFEEEKDA